MRTLLVLALFALIAPAARADNEYWAPVQAELDAAKARWAQQGTTDYGYTVTRGCLCPDTQPQKVQVRGNLVYADPSVKPYASVKRLFDAVQTAINEKYSNFRVTYAPSGMPVAIFLDPIANAADDETQVDVSGFETQTGSVTGGQASETESPAVAVNATVDATQLAALADARELWAKARRRNYRLSINTNGSRRVARVRRGKLVGPGPTVGKVHDYIDYLIRARVPGFEVVYNKIGLPTSVRSSLGFATFRLLEL